MTTGVIPDVPVDFHGKHTIRHVVYDTASFNFSEAINTGRAAATGDFLLLLNDDTTVAELRELASRYPQPRSALLPMLHLIQSVDGRISPEEALGLKLA